MSKYIKFDKDHYNKQGLISLTRGDDWSLSGRVIDYNCKEELPYDLTDKSATAYFEGETTPIAKAITIDSATQGKFSFTVPAADTENAALALDGSTMYLIVNGTTSGTTETIETENPDIEVKDRGFNN